MRKGGGGFGFAPLFSPNLYLKQKSLSSPLLIFPQKSLDIFPDSLDSVGLRVQFPKQKIELLVCLYVLYLANFKTDFPVLNFAQSLIDKVSANHVWRAIFCIPNSGDRVFDNLHKAKSNRHHAAHLESFHLIAPFSLRESSSRRQPNAPLRRYCSGLGS